VASLLQEMRQFGNAYQCYEYSRDYFGDRDETLFCMAICQVNLNNFSKAKELLTATLKINPDHILAKGWLKHMEDKAL
jgi:hypothetical protein